LNVACLTNTNNANCNEIL